MFVTRQNGVIKLKLVSSVDKSIKAPLAPPGFFAAMLVGSVCPPRGSGGHCMAG